MEGVGDGFVDCLLIQDTFAEHVASKRDPRRGVEGSEGLPVRAKDMMRFVWEFVQVIYRHV
jgi:hypothetical protein